MKAEQITQLLDEQAFLYTQLVRWKALSDRKEIILVLKSTGLELKLNKQLITSVINSIEARLAELNNLTIGKA